MNTQDKRFLAAALGEGFDIRDPELWDAVNDPAFENALGNPNIGGFILRHSLEWPFPPHAGIKSLTIHSRSSSSPPFARLVLTASWGGDITGTELSVGLDLALEPHDTSDVFDKSEHLIGQLVAPETAPATRNTVQVDFAERLTPGTSSFGLTKLRGRILWQAGARHIIRFHRQMPKGWPEAPHVETDESAFTGRTDPIHPPSGRGFGSSVYFGVPILTTDRRKIVDVNISKLTTALAWLRENTG